MKGVKLYILNLSLFFRGACTYIRETFNPKSCFSFSSFFSLFPLFSLVASSYRFVRPRVFLQCEHTRRHARRGGGDGGGGGGGHARGRHFHPGVRATAQPEPKR